MKKLIVEKKNKKKNKTIKNKDGSMTLIGRGSLAGFYSNPEQGIEIFNANTEYNKPVDASKESSITVDDIIGGVSAVSGNCDGSLVSSGDMSGDVSGDMSGGMGESFKKLELDESLFEEDVKSLLDKKVYIKSKYSMYDGEWGTVVDENVDDDEYFVAIADDKDCCPIFGRRELKVAK